MEKPVSEDGLLAQVNKLTEMQARGEYAHLHVLASGSGFEKSTFDKFPFAQIKTPVYWSMEGRDVYVFTFDFKNPTDVNAAKVFKYSFEDSRNLNLAADHPLCTGLDAVRFLQAL